MTGCGAVPGTGTAGNLTRTWVWHSGDDRVVGYYSLAPYFIEREALSRAQGRGLPERIPCYLLARLALDRSLRSQGLGSQLLASALLRVAGGGSELGGRFVVVDAIEEDAASLVLDSHGLTMLAGNRARLEELRRRGEWPAIVPSVVLAEALTGDHRRDFPENRLLRTCDVRPVEEQLARIAARLRSRVGARRLLSAVDAIVVALADEVGGATVLSSDQNDLGALARHTTNQVKVGSG